MIENQISEHANRNHVGSLILAATAAFCTYFCMYAFRKPFAAGTYEGQEFLGLGLKTVLVISQLAGYMVSKFIGIKVVAEMPAKYRATSIIGLILVAELALVGFAYAPDPVKVVMLFFNGLPLGMIFGIVLSYLEGRKQTEALSAVLCASFIISSGVVKSVGRWLIEARGVSEFHMPMMTGVIFLVPLLLSVLALQLTPPPDQTDRKLRKVRSAMDRRQRNQFLAAYWPGLALMVLVYVALTVVRTIRDDFGVEIWQAMGVTETPSVFARSEMVVGLCVTALNGLAVCFVNNVTAIRNTVAMMCLAFLLVAASAFLQSSSQISPFVFMVLCGVGMYLPYVAFHTTVFERLIAASKHPCNLGFLMYLADAIGYLGYATLLMVKSKVPDSDQILPFFRFSMIFMAALSIVSLIGAVFFFSKTLESEELAEMEVLPEPIPQPES
ncbi:DUF5690 family protein [Thalassoglobus polymorphus]|uniref:Major Facilitator Superfamily protein n=1 Tax=Thalassoglobus polymorphus TaxID=2527994 RepID=A0A517QLN8_9PLAN|nr:DUF5690 family protein [Thalassoglobus polymorphus]QDT32447.1 hypothetical protein Mal48_16930 [Thalassoglobus polymorphus]